MTYATQLVPNAGKITVHIDNTHVLSTWSKLDDYEASSWIKEPSRDLYVQMRSIKKAYDGILGIIHVKVSPRLCSIRDDR